MALRVVTRFKVGDCHETEGAGIAKLLAITSRKEYPLVWNDASIIFSTTADGKVYADGRYSIRDIIGDPVPEPEGFKVEVVAPESDAEYSDAEYVARMMGCEKPPEKYDGGCDFFLPGSTSASCFEDEEIAHLAKVFRRLEAAKRSD